MELHHFASKQENQHVIILRLLSTHNTEEQIPGRCQGTVFFWGNMRKVLLFAMVSLSVFSYS